MHFWGWGDKSEFLTVQSLSDVKMVCTIGFLRKFHIKIGLAVFDFQKFLKIDTP